MSPIPAMEVRATPKRTFRKFIRSLVHVGLHSEEDRHLLIVLEIAKWLLSLASGYTTFDGMSQLAPWPAALLVTIAIQALIYVTASRMATVIRLQQSVASTVSIYLAAMIASVVFSHSSLLNHIYSLAHRGTDHKAYLSQEGNDLLAQVGLHTEEYLQSEKAGFAQLAQQQWTRQLLSTLGARRVEMTADARLALSACEAARTAWRKELEQGGTLTAGGTRTRPGTGPTSRRLKAESEQKCKAAEGAKGKISDIEVAYNEAEREILALVSGEPELRHSIAARCIRTGGGPECNVPPEVEKAAAKLEQRVHTFARFRSCLQPLSDKAELDETQEQLDACMRLATDVVRPSDELREAYRVIRNKNISAENQFVVAFHSLSRLQPIALVALGVAIMVDALILLCGVLSARPVNFLDLRSREELDELAEVALVTVMGIDKSDLPKTFDDARGVREQAKMVLGACESVQELAVKHLGLVLPEQAIRAMGLQLHVALWISLDVVVPMARIGAAPNVDQLKERHAGGVALRTRFSLWLAHQVVIASDVNDLDSALGADLEKLAEYVQQEPY